MARIPAALSGLWKRERPMIGPRLDELEYLVPAAQRAAPPQHEAKMSGRDVQWYRDLGNILGRGASNYRVGQYEWTQEQIRDLTLCDGFAERAVDSLVLGSLHGKGIVVDFGSDYVNRLWEKWRWNSFDEEDDIITLQRLMARAVVRDGEIFLVSRSSEYGPGLFLDWHNSRMVDRANGVWQGHRQGGIEFDQDYRPAFYHFARVTEQGEYNPHSRVVVVPAFRVAHVYRQDFDGQVRGISWLRPSIDAIEKLSKYTDDVTDALDILVKMPQYIQLSEDFGQLELSNATASELLDLALRASVDRRVAIPPGAELKSLQTPDMLRGSQVAEIEGVHERRVSRGTGVSTHTLTGSQSDANLSSIRAGEAENQQVYQRLQHVLTKGVKKVVRIWLDYHRIIDPQVREVWASGEVDYKVSGGGYIDYRDKSAESNQVRDGLKTRSSVFRDRGEDPEQVYAEMKEDALRMAEIRRIEQGGELEAE